MTTTLEAQGLVEQLDPAALALAAAAPEPAAPEAPVPVKRSSRKSVLALSVCALAINGSAAIYTSPADFSSLNIGSLAELLPRRDASAPKPDPVVAALKDIQSAQQQHTASLQENNQALQQNAALLQQDTMVLLSLRQSITDERFDVRKISSQLSTLIAKVDSLQGAMMSDVTSSIRRANARYGLSAAMRKRMVRQSKSVGPVSVGGAPLSMPAAVAAPES
ncbi:putative coiled-coil protein SlyX [Bradyrhizobium diazoefficiens]|nr:putative coiled-coil protein SlyX [Bradyrhizobium japonicum]